ncbi:hypothetical protein MYX84_13670, partial [Acidobacteria bacterium AH-259-O06]|nr:hypothetical protein [Acidobacteria bacterium AH-259-O06]
GSQFDKFCNHKDTETTKLCALRRSLTLTGVRTFRPLVLGSLDVTPFLQISPDVVAQFFALLLQVLVVLSSENVGWVIVLPGGISSGEKRCARLRERKARS